jgi:hypothetical protein
MREEKMQTIDDPHNLEGEHHHAGIENHHLGRKLGSPDRLCELG